MVKRRHSAEAYVRQVLESEFGMTFPKRVIQLGRVAKEFDAVSANGEIVAMVKAFGRLYQESTPMQLKTRQDRCIIDCAWLTRMTAKTKLLVFVERDYAEWFRPYGKALFPDVTIRWIS